ncbi:two-component sensor histidine kinase, partial [Modestobacter sp. VKM Ac-2676]
MDPTAHERLAAWLRRHPFAVDSAFAALFFLFTTVLGAGYAGDAGVILGLLLSIPLAWRRRSPVWAAAAVVVVSLIQLVGFSDLLGANLAALVMVYALAAYAPRWASKAGLVTGLVGSVLAAATFYTGPYDPASLVVISGAIGVSVVAAWALGDLRRNRVLRMAGLEERARLLELEHEQEMRLAAQAERARIAREMHDVVAHSLSVVIAQADAAATPARPTRRPPP